MTPIWARPDQTLEKHLKDVADISVEYLSLVQAQKKNQNYVFIMGLSHDFGKITSFFQSALISDKKSSFLSQHSLLSAFWSYWILNKAYDEIDPIYSFLSIRHHHGNFGNIRDEGTKLSEDLKKIVYPQVNDILADKAKKKFIKNLYDIEFVNFCNDLDDVYKRIRKKLRRFLFGKEDDYLFLQYLTALLQTADKDSLITGSFFIPQKDKNDNYLIKYKKTLFNSSNSIIQEVREDSFKDVSESIQKADIDKQKIFSITLPTGAGKTLCGYNTAFRLANRIYGKSGYMPRIIYALPFLSIADQNYNVLEKIFSLKEVFSSTDILLHHSMTEISYKRNGIELEGYDARFCVENWQSGVIVSSFVKLFDTIFKAGSKHHAHRFVALSNSIIILDEVQAIPVKFHDLFKTFIQILTKKFNTYIILMTATQPGLLSCEELASFSETYFNRLSRVSLKINFKKILLFEFIEKFLQEIEKSDNSYLIILNTVASAKEAFKFISDNNNRPDVSVEYLSSEIIPVVRKRKLKRIKENLVRKKQVVLISTQVVEAGVDIDFDIVIRDLAPLDCVIQSAGRCNRHNSSAGGEVRLICIENNNVVLGNQIYGPVLIETTKEVFCKNSYKENEFLELSKKYYKMLRERFDDDGFLLQLLNKGDFKKMCDEFSLIDEQPYKKTYIVDWDKKSHNLIGKLSRYHDLDFESRKQIWCNLAHYRVNLTDKQVEDVNYILVNSEMPDVHIITKSFYDENGPKPSNQLDF